MKNFLIAVLVAAVGLLTGVSEAAAADTWLPEFKADTHVYVSPEMQGRVKLGNDFATKVQQSGTSHGLETYVVVTQQGDELAAGDRENWAPNMLHNRLWGRWQFESSFDESRVLIVLYIRAKDSDAGCIAVRSGSYLHGKGLDRDHFASSSGPVMPTAKQYMRTDPQLGLLTILGNINAEIDNGGVATGLSAPGWFGWPTWVWIIIIIVAIVLILCLIVKATGGSGGGDSWFFAGCGGSGCSGGGGGGGCGGGCGGGGGC